MLGETNYQYHSKSTNTDGTTQYLETNIKYLSLSITK